MSMRRTTPSARFIDNNPFTHLAFFGRQHELQQIHSYLKSNPPQCCAIIGETFIGKTTLLRHLLSSQEIKSSQAAYPFTFAYLDCASYAALSKSDSFISIQFWWDMYTSIQTAIETDKENPLPQSLLDFDSAPIETAYKIKVRVEELIRKHKRPIIILLDDFEGVAKLPPSDSNWLRAMVQQTNCTYVVTSRYQPYVLNNYHPDNFVSPSPLSNLFSDAIYLGLLTEKAVVDFLDEASKKAQKYGSHWQEDDIKRIRNLAGRHPELLRIVCKHFFNYRLSAPNPQQKSYERFDFYVSMEAKPIYRWLWHSLSNPELRGEHSIEQSQEEEQLLSPHQRVFLTIAQEPDIDQNELVLNDDTITLSEILFTLEQRGFIEQLDGKWRVFSELMRQFVLKQAHLYQDISLSEPIASSATYTKNEGEANREQGMLPESDFTYLEGQVYSYLKTHLGKICSRNEIKRAVWKDESPSDSALQKIIERIRLKIEPDPENPYFLVAVRGQGYMLRNSVPSRY